MKEKIWILLSNKLLSQLSVQFSFFFSDFLLLDDIFLVVVDTIFESYISYKGNKKNLQKLLFFLSTTVYCCIEYSISVNQTVTLYLLFNFRMLTVTAVTPPSHCCPSVFFCCCYCLLGSPVMIMLFFWINFFSIKSWKQKILIYNK